MVCVVIYTKWVGNIVCCVTGKTWAGVFESRGQREVFVFKGSEVTVD